MRKYFVLSLCAIAAGASAQLRLAEWNVTNYSGGRDAEFKSAIYGIYSGRSMSPDVFMGTEFLSQAGVNNFLTILNTAPGSPGDWAVAPWHDGPDSDSAFFYRTTKVQFVAQTVIAFGSTSGSNQPRDTVRYDFRPLGYSSASTTMAAYVCHMKAGSAGSDISRRQVECQNIVNNIATLPAGYSPIVAGDFNMQSSSQTPYVTLVGTAASPGPMYDPIKTPGSWDGNSNFKIVHTQDPASAGTMNSRYDFILLGGNLITGKKLTYIGNPSLAYSTTTWNDPNHSYRCWGNDGTSFGTKINTTSNSMVGPTIATDLMNSAQSGGHLAVYLDMKVPARIGATALNLDFGVCDKGSVHTLPITVNHTGDLVKWTAAGLSNLNYTFSQTGVFKGPAGNFSLAPGASANHNITFDTTTPGVYYGTVVISSDDTETPALTINYHGVVSQTRTRGGGSNLRLIQPMRIH